VELVWTLSEVCELPVFETLGLLDIESDRGPLGIGASMEMELVMMSEL